MRLVVGLGNPGGEYTYTRHNVGFLVLDSLVNKLLEEVQNPDFKFQKKFNSEILMGKDYLFAKPQTYMNSSGTVVTKLASFYKIPPSRLYVIHDDLDIAFGEYKICLGIGPKVHNGVNSVEQAFGRKDFWRVSVGVDNRELQNRIDGEEYVLQTFTEEEKTVLKSVIERVVDDLVEIFFKDD